MDIVSSSLHKGSKYFVSYVIFILVIPRWGLLLCQVANLNRALILPSLETKISHVSNVCVGGGREAGSSGDIFPVSPTYVFREGLMLDLMSPISLTTRGLC